MAPSPVRPAARPGSGCPGAGWFCAGWFCAGWFGAGRFGAGRFGAGRFGAGRFSAAGLALLAPLSLSLAARAATTAECRPFRERRDALAAQAMTAEIALVHQTRQRLCPREERLSAGANADDRSYEPIDYPALIACRHRAEAELRRTHRVRYRNRRGFLFYTAQGADLARQADAVEQQARGMGCP